MTSRATRLYEHKLRQQQQMIINHLTRLLRPILVVFWQLLLHSSEEIAGIRTAKVIKVDEELD